MGDISRQYRNSSELPWLAGAWLLLLVVVIVVYMPGLGGPFVLDDYWSIAALGNHGGVVDWQSFKAFVFGGTSGPTGRPLSLMTFLIDGTNWPADPAPFKRTNLAIHLMVGVSLGLLINQVLRLLQFEKQEARWVTLISVACWLLHPFLVSTTLYVVQRMAQLATLFVLVGLVFYLYGRSFLLTNKRKAYVLMSLSVPLFTLLATMSKENGALLPVLIGVIEITVIASQRERLGTINRYWLGLFVILPTFAIGAYLGKQFFNVDFFDVVPPRDFSLYERMLTQPRVLADYLQNWFAPQLYTAGAYQDHFSKSTGLLSPVSTLLAIVFHVTVISALFIYRRKWPLLALAALFYYGSHLIESTVISLELYFEHRNYLSACFLAVPLVVFLKKHMSPRVFIAATMAAMLILAGFTRYSATIWKSTPSIVEAWASKAPTSARAQVQYAHLLLSADLQEEALQVIEKAIQNIPQSNPLLLVNRLVILCNMNKLKTGDFQESAKIVSSTLFDTRMLAIYHNFAEVVVEQKCPNNSVESLMPMFNDMLDVPANADPTTSAHAHIQFLIGYVQLFSGEPQRALSAFEKSIHASADASYAMVMAALMASSEYRAEALQLSNLALSHLAETKESILTGTRVTEVDITEFRSTVQAEIDSARDADRTGPVR